MTLKRVGFFKELTHGDPSGPSLVEDQGKLVGSEQGDIGSYLHGAPVLATTGEMVDDWFDGTKRVAYKELRTDGEWVWPGDLAYYVEKYHVALPYEFLRHMAERNWVPPQLSHEQLLHAEDALFSQ